VSEDTVISIVIGSLKGNMQSVGKDIVAEALKSAGFQVFDLGVNVAPEDFVEAAVRRQADVVAISISVDETLPYLRDIVSLLRKKKLRGKIKTVIGGRAVSEEKRRQYAIDAYAIDAEDCVKQVRNLLSLDK
jgi:5-methyltetrahydrofolate--homocysteine methyltransferase